MTEQHEEERAILIDREAGAAYAVPLAVLEAHQATPEQRAKAKVALADVAGYTASTTEAGDPQAEAPLYALTAEELAPYRLSDEEARAAETAAADGDDTAGFDHNVNRLKYVEGTTLVARDGLGNLYSMWGGYHFRIYSPPGPDRNYFFGGYNPR